MKLRALLPAVPLPLLAAIAACSVSASSPSTPTTVEEARSSLPRMPASQVAPSALTAVVAANNAFAVDLYAQIRAGQPAGSGNLLTSPLSASLALTMTYAGAQGQTATGMASALHLGPDAQSVFDGQNALAQALDGRAAAALASAQQTAKQFLQPAPSPADFQVQIVNSVWGEKTYPWEAPFLDVMAKDYGAGVNLVDFVTAAESARVTINGWVSTETADKINDLLPVGSLDSTTRMVLVNAIHLKLPWQSAFAPSLTVPATFTKASGATVSVPFMNEAAAFPYRDDGQAQIVALPLAGGQMSVVIALPHGDLATYEGALAAGSAALAQPSSYDTVALSLPRFAFTSPTFSLKGSLVAMGMAQAFDASNADFKGLCANPPDGSNLYIADVLQKTMVAVEETGVEAAAATAVIVDGSSSSGAPPAPVPMVVDRPFLMAIVDVPTGAILFLGHVGDPSAATAP